MPQSPNVSLLSINWLTSELYVVILVHGTMAVNAQIRHHFLFEKVQLKNQTLNMIWWTQKKTVLTDCVTVLTTSFNWSPFVSLFVSTNSRSASSFRLLTKQETRQHLFSQLLLPRLTPYFNTTFIRISFYRKKLVYVIDCQKQVTNSLHLLCSLCRHNRFAYCWWLHVHIYSWPCLQHRTQRGIEQKVMTYNRCQ